ncbi:CotO family spore coat protein [Cytobacillus sp. FSL W7-1323]|uniref:Spore coat protein CotO n=1 Tax=Cytobacillus kochii TaxID=859143 RepID=A0A248TDG4_9BACI|nr:MULTISPECIES: CotO family spore coat protein [Cytobacillus]ASV66204.1 hypothetical protein CKF48_01985 [Cytobacillus kochii]MDQ0186982.1 hypothetical protein [Cytobacillus kochii]MEA1851685.1 CotO family spore coat protein [Cytobacillus sp. OWB-43]MED1603729.1 CotO family spore coat protein [Cytobacillus kochii]
MDTQNKKKKPLLYVQQSNLPSPSTSMQSTYSSKNEVEEEEKEVITNSSIDEQGEVEKKEEHVQQVLEEYEESQSESEQGFNRVKSFKDMNVQERIDYLLHFPKQLPPVPCLFISDDKHIRGFIELKQGNELMIKTLSGSMQTIHIHSIKSIKMVGFR